MSFLEGKNISVYKNNRVILKDINFKLEEGEDAIVYSGVKTGSTLFLKIIDNMVTNTQGELLFRGENVLSYSEEQRIEYSYNISFVYEEKGLLHSMSIMDNIIYPVKKCKEYDEELLDELIEDFKIGDILHKEPSEINDIDTSVVNIVRAILVKPKIILYDEVDGGMDLEKVNKVLESIKKYKNRIGFTQIFTTVKDYEYAPYSNCEKKYKLFKGTLEQING